MTKPNRDDEPSDTALMGLVALVFVCAYVAHLVFLAWDWVRGDMDNETQIKRTIEVIGFVDHDGLPTCSRRALSADCKFLGTRSMGFKPVCNFLGVDLQRSEKGVGYLRPAGGCPVWSEA